jgi:uncharacterized protein
MASVSMVSRPVLCETTDGFSPLSWVLHDGKLGMASQALGLAEAVGFSLIEKRLAIRFPWTHLPPRLWFFPFAATDDGDRLSPPWPELVIGCGQNAAIPALAIRRASDGYAVTSQIQNPRVGKGEFDLIVVPEHDGLVGPRVIVTRGAVHRITQARFAAERSRFATLAAMPRPILTVPIGGTNKAYRLMLRRMAEIADTLGEILQTQGDSALVTPLRRTGSGGVALLRDRLKRLPPSSGITQVKIRILPFSLDDTERAGAALRVLALSRIEQRLRA